jgi:fatty acid synthase subunit alpha, fungi type
MTLYSSCQRRIDTLKAHHFNSSWTWVQQDVLLMYYDIIFRSQLTTVDCEITAHCIALLNHTDPDMLTYMQYHISQCDPLKGDTYKFQPTVNR